MNNSKRINFNRFQRITGLITITIFSIFLLQTTAMARGRIKLKRKSPSTSTIKDSDANLAGDISRRTTSSRGTISLGKKDVWLAVGLSLILSGSGHFYVGKYSSGIIFFVGSTGLMAAGITSMLSSHTTKDIVVDGKIAREEDNTNKPLFMIGSIFLISGIIFYLGSVIDIFLEVSEYNRRIDRLRRYENSRASRHFQWYFAQRDNSYYAGQTMRF